MSRASMPARRAVMLVALAPLLSGVGARADDDDGRAEVEIKAAFLFKFLAFVEWPAQAFEHADSPLGVGVVGADMLADELQAIVESRQVNGRRVALHRLHPGDTAKAAVGGLHVLFVGRSASARLPAFVEAARGRPLLVISESDEAFALGSAINFVVVDDKVRFDIALHAAERAGLKVSARLLAVARRVLTGPT